MKHFKNIHLGKSTVVLSKVGTVTKPSVIKIDNSNQDVQDEIVPWGTDNLYPQNFYNKKYLKNGAAVGGISVLKSTHYGNGIKLVQEVEDELEGTKLKKVSVSKFPEISLFFRQNKIKRFWYETITDQSLFQIAFTEYVLSVDFKKIVRIKRLQAAHCRFGVQNEKTGRIDYVYVNTDWESNQEKYRLKIAYMHPDMTPLEILEYCKQKKIYNFCTATYYPLVDESYYPKADWHAVDRSGWIDVANSVPELKQAIFENQLHFKHIVYVSDYYFENFYKEEWDDFDSEKRQSLREELAQEIDDHLSGNKAGGRSLISPMFEENGKFVEGIKVVAVDNKLKDGSYLPDASAANSEILFAIGVDPTIIGAGIPGGSNLSGSGSDKREAYTILCANLTPKRELTLEIWELIRDYNGWPPELEATFPNVNLTTLDKNPNGQEEIIR